MNILSREKQIEVIAALCEGVGQRAITRLTGTDRKTVDQWLFKEAGQPRCGGRAVRCPLQSLPRS
jgi:hypothetical protein